MSTNDTNHLQAAGDAALRMALRGLRRDAEPDHDLWPGIAARIQSLPQQQAGPARRTPGWLGPMAIAASMVLAVGVVWKMPQFAASPVADGGTPILTTPAAGSHAATLVQREADAMTIEYQAALRELAPESVPAGWEPGLAALDRSAEQIRVAMEQNPDSRLLLERLRATYARRLALSRRALYA